MVAEADHGNQRVTNAVLAMKLDTIIDRIDGVCDRQDKHLERLRYVESEQTKIKERLGLFAGLQLFISLVLSAIAGVLGMKN